MSFRRVHPLNAHQGKPKRADDPAHCGNYAISSGKAAPHPVESEARNETAGRRVNAPGPAQKGWPSMQLEQDISARHGAQRASIQHAVGRLADELLRRDDLLPHLDAHERTVRFAGCLGDIATDLCENRGMDQDEALLRLGAEVQLALEARERDRAAA